MPTDEHLAPDGRVLEVLSEHLCQGWLEGYLLTGRHGLFNCYEAFIHIVDSMFNQHAKWLKVTREIPWRRPIASLNYLLSSHVWRQDHNGFSHQDPGFIDHVVNKKAEIIRVYLPPDANTLLSVADHCLRSRHYVNVIVAGKQPALDYLSMDDAIVHCTRGLGHLGVGVERRGRRARRRARLQRRRSDARDARGGGDPPRAAAGAEGARRERRRPDAAAARDRASARTRATPSSTRSSRPTGRSCSRTTAIPWLIHRLTYRRTNHANMHVRGYKEEGTTTTPFDMVMLNDLDRFHLVMDVIDRVPGLRDSAGRPAPGDAGPPARRARIHARARRGRPGDPRLDLAVLSGARRDPRRQRGLDEPEAVASSTRTSASTVGRGLRRGRRGRAPDRPLRRSRRRRRRDRRGGVRTHRARRGGRAAAQPRRRSRRSSARSAALPDVPHVAVFDAHFHASMPDEARQYAIPRSGGTGTASSGTASTGSRSSGWPSRCACRGSSSATSAAAAP